MGFTVRWSVRDRAFIAIGAGFAIAMLGGCGASGPRVQTGPNAEKSPDGLHRVDGVRSGTLYMQPDYSFGSYDEFTLGETLVTFQKDARVLPKDDQENLTRIFEEVATEVIEGTGRKKVAAPGPCVAVVTLALVDMEITGTQALGGTAGIGAVTLVLDIRDGHTREPLLRYGSRSRLSGASLSAAFKRFAKRFEKDFQRALPAAEPGAALPCEERSNTSVPVRSE
jgi:hypothetical protein